MILPISVALALSTVLSCFLTVVLLDTIKNIEDGGSKNKKLAIKTLYYLYWSINMITISLGYTLYEII